MLEVVHDSELERAVRIGAADERRGCDADPLVGPVYSIRYETGAPTGSVGLVGAEGDAAEIERRSQSSEDLVNLVASVNRGQRNIISSVWLRSA